MGLLTVSIQINHELWSFEQLVNVIKSTFYGDQIYPIIVNIYKQQQQQMQYTQHNYLYTVFIMYK